MIIDQVHLLVQAGNGGNGCESYYYRPDKKRVPNGGNGGKGANIIFRATHNAAGIASLRYKQHIIAESGEHGKSNRKQGKNGEDLVINVPCGTRIFDRESNFLIRELPNDNDEVIVVEGGLGGSGNYGGKTHTHGEPGQRIEIQVTTRIKADIFIVGLPNSGKSTFLNHYTRAHVKQGDYPFATRDPEIGVWNASDFEQITFCEMPSIYRSSHEGRGVGMSFLKHLENSKLNIFFLDPVSQFAHDVEEGYQVLREQISREYENFLKKPSIVVINKIDLPEAQAQLEEKKPHFDVPVFYISAQTGEGLEELSNYLKEQLLEIK